MKKVFAMGAIGALGLSTLAFVPVSADETDGRYLITTQPSSSLEAKSLDIPGEVVENYSAVNVVVADMTATKAKELNQKPGVIVSPDEVISLGDPSPPKQKKPGGTQLGKEKSSDDVETSPNAVASWGLDRVDQRDIPLNGGYNPPAGVDGKSVHIYVIDTGSNTGHPEFAGRVGNSKDFVGDGKPPTTDCHFHGTHVMGTAAGKTYGIAKQATVHAVRVLNCGGGGTYSGVIGGMDWVASNATKPAVANMSLGGPKNATLNAAAERLVARGVTLAVAAGNEADNADFYSPASAPSALTVAASDNEDYDAPYSNYGTSVDLFAPGSDIESIFGPADGTSMASPHVAGVSALILGENKNASPAQVRVKLIGDGTKGRIRNEVGGTPDILPYVKDIRNSDPNPPPPPRKRTKTKLKAKYGKSRLKVNVNPNQCGWNYKFKVLKKKGSRWKKVYRGQTRGCADTKIVNRKRGTYRVRTYAQRGYSGSTSNSVYLRR